MFALQLSMPPGIRGSSVLGLPDSGARRWRYATLVRTRLLFTDVGLPVMEWCRTSRILLAPVDAT